MNINQVQLWAVMAAVIFSGGCGPARLSRQTLLAHPRVSVDVAQPSVVEASVPLMPRWVLEPERGAVAFVGFTGQSSAPTLDAAKLQAERDLYAAVSSFVSVDVKAEFEASEWERQSGGTVEGGQSIDSKVATKTQSSLEGVTIDQIYWEKVQASALLPDHVSYRFYSYARVPKIEITRARLKKQLERRAAGGKKTVVVLPFRPVLTSTPELAALADAFAEELSRRLAGAGELHVSDPGLVAGLLTPERRASEAASLEAVRDALMPDYVVGGGYQLHRDRLHVTFTIYDASQAPSATGEVERAYDQLFQLQDALVADIQKGLAVASARTEVTPAPRDVDAARRAFELYHAAGAAYAAGDNAGALGALREAIRIAPDSGRAYLRYGRVQERLGRYGWIVAEAPARRTPWLDLCVDFSELAKEDRVAFLQRSAAGATASSNPEDLGAEVAVVLSAAQFLIAGGPEPDPGVPAIPRSAVEAYWHALRVARATGDARLELEVRIALADLASRTDRFQEARALYEGVLTAPGEAHFEGLALFGLGRLAREEGGYAEAMGLLRRALQLRSLLAEKPYLLEVLNELGGLSVEMNQLALAHAFYRRALRIAEDLGNEYFQAVLGNNVGVLEYLQGRPDRAEIHFHRAHRILSELDEADGLVSAGLNIGILDARKGDLESARAYLESTRNIVSRTAQLGRFAEVHEATATRALLAGELQGGLRDLIRAWSIMDSLGRASHRIRLESAIAVAELRRLTLAHGLDDPKLGEAISCVQAKLHRMMTRAYGRDLSSLAGRFWDEAYDYDHRYGYRRWNPDPSSAQLAKLALQRDAEAGSGRTELPERWLSGDGLTALYLRLNAELVGRLK